MFMQCPCQGCQALCVHTVSNADSVGGCVSPSASGCLTGRGLEGEGKETPVSKLGADLESVLCRGAADGFSALACCTVCITTRLLSASPS